MKNKIIVWTLRLLTLVIFCVALAFFYAWKIEPKFLTITRQEIVLEKATGTTKIVVLSDFHFNKEDRARAEEIIKKRLLLTPMRFACSAITRIYIPKKELCRWK